MRNKIRTERYLIRLCSLVVLISVVCCQFAVAQPDGETNRWLENVPEPKPVEMPTIEEVDEAIDNGINFLLDDQNSNGSWGSATRTKGLNIYAPVPGAHHAFRAAVTGLCVSALIEEGGNRSDVQRSIDKAQRWLEENLPQVRRAVPTAIYNVWAHAYCIRALADLYYLRDGHPEQQARFLKLMEQQVDLLVRYEGIDGGWGYYDFGAQTQRPNAQPTSFTTATILIALKEAEEMGVKTPQRVIERAIDSLQRQQKPDFSYYYSDNGPITNRPMRSINRPGGSLGRSQVCNLALRLWQRPEITNQVLDVWLDRLFARNLWLDIGRKRPIPHESHFLVAGYFFYYGHYYAAACIQQLPASARPPHCGQLMTILLNLQERDGSWWDFPFYDYHQPYGTAMAIMALNQCREEAEQ